MIQIRFFDSQWHLSHADRCRSISPRSSLPELVPCLFLGELVRTSASGHTTEKRALKIDENALALRLQEGAGLRMGTEDGTLPIQLRGTAEYSPIGI